MKKRRKAVCFAAVAAFVCAAFAGFSASAAYGDEFSDIIWEYEQDFSDIESVRADFTGYYVYDMGGSKDADPIAASLAEANEYNRRFYIAGGKLVRNFGIAGDIDNSMGTKSFAIATFTRQKYTNFVLRVTYETGALTDLWPVVAFRQSDAGRYFLEDGVGVFVQSGGKTTVWGGLGVGGPYEDTAIAGYQKSVKHVMTLAVTGTGLAVYIDDASAPVYRHVLPRSSFASGYVSLLSINNDCKFSAFKIAPLPVTPLPEPWRQPPAPDAATEDSLGALAGGEASAFDELSGHKQDMSRPK
jgi:hypothetical protein